MSKIVSTEEIKAEVKKAGEEIKTIQEEVQDTVKTAETVKDSLSVAKGSCPVIGQVPLPGSGGGKGTVVKK